MKHSTIYYSDNKIELHNTLLGKETVIVNGHEVSERRSIGGTTHRFTVSENGVEKQAQLTTKTNMNGANFDLFVDNKPVIEIPEDNTPLFFFMLLILIPIFINIFS